MTRRYTSADQHSCLPCGRRLHVVRSLSASTRQRRGVTVQVQTNAFVFLVDADFVPSGTPGVQRAAFKRDPALQRIRQTWKANGQRHALILPAFGRNVTNLHETPEASPCYPDTADCWLYHKLDVPSTKAKVVEMVATGEVEPFYRTLVRSK